MAIKILQIHLWTEKDPVREDLRLYMQVLEQSGLPADKPDGKVRIVGSPDISSWYWPDDNNARRLFLRGEDHSERYKTTYCTYGEANPDNIKRIDDGFDDVIKYISEEIFGGVYPESQDFIFPAQKVWVRNSEDEEWVPRKLIQILPANYHQRYVCEWETDRNRVQLFSMISEEDLFGRRKADFEPRDKLFTWIVQGNQQTETK